MLIDVMKEDYFVCQLKYEKRGFPKIVDGNIIETFDAKDIQKFVESQRPSLKGTNYRIAFSEQRR